MFTGIVAGTLEVVKLNRKEGLLQYTIKDEKGFLADVKIGGSVSVNGVCQTLVSTSSDFFSFEAIEETLSCSNLNQLEVGSLVNIERSLKFGDEIGGHLLSGHVIGTVKIQEIKKKLHNIEIVYFCNPKWMCYLFPKGFVAINGVSLTIGGVNKIDGTFSTHLIPETADVTLFKYVRVGDLVNLEIDSQTQILVESVKEYMGGLYTQSS